MRWRVNHMTASASLSPPMAETTRQETIKERGMETFLVPKRQEFQRIFMVPCLCNLTLLMKLPIGPFLTDCFLTFYLRAIETFILYHVAVSLLICFKVRNREEEEQQKDIFEILLPIA